MGSGFITRIRPDQKFSNLGLPSDYSTVGVYKIKQYSIFYPSIPKQMSSFSTVVMTTLNRNINYKKNLKLQHFDIFKGFQVNKKICADKPFWSARLRTFYIPELNKKNRIVKYCRENSETTVFPPKSRN